MNIKKVIRRKAALSRFSVMTEERFHAVKGKDADYKAYSRAKNDELKSLNNIK